MVVAYIDVHTVDINNRTGPISGKKMCVRTHQALRTLWMQPGRAHTTPNAKRTGNVNSDAARHGTVYLDAVYQGAVRRTQHAVAPCIRTPYTRAPCVRTQLAMASAYQTERVRAFSFWTQLCQGIFLLDAAVSGHFPSGRSRVRANSVRMTRVMAPQSRCLSRHGTS